MNTELLKAVANKVNNEDSIILWDILNKYVEPKKYDVITIKIGILKKYNLTYFQSDNNVLTGIVLSDFFLNSFCEKMYKVFICNTIINISYVDIQEVLID